MRLACPEGVTGSLDDFYALDASPLRAVALGPALPRILRGPGGAVAMQNVG